MNELQWKLTLLWTAIPGDHLNTKHIIMCAISLLLLLLIVIGVVILLVLYVNRIAVNRMKRVFIFFVTLNSLKEEIIVLNVNHETFLS